MSEIMKSTDVPIIIFAGTEKDNELPKYWGEKRKLVEKQTGKTFNPFQKLIVLESNAIRLAIAAQNALDWLENAPIDYSNGVTHDGFDEGRVRGNQGHEKLVAELQFALASYHQGENDV